MRIPGTARLALLAALVATGGPTTPQTGESAEPVFRFGIVADVQYCDADPAGARYYRNSLEKLRGCVEDLNQRDLAFTIQLGDLIDRDFDSFDRVLPVYQSLKSRAYHVAGNHDFSVAQDEKAKVLGRLGLKEGYYDFAFQAWRFVVLDGNDLSLYASDPGSARYEAALATYQALEARGAANAHTWNGALGTQQMEWLEDRLAAADRAGEKVLVFCHFPVFPENAHNLWNDREVVQLLGSHPSVVAYLAGHNHAGNDGQRDGIHYLTLQGMVDTPHENAYAVAEVYEDRLEICGVGRVPSRTLMFRPTSPERIPGSAE